MTNHQETGILVLREDTMQRFDDKWVRDPTTGCHNWTAYKDKKGYGKFGYAKSVWPAHRVAWTLANGPIPPGKVVHHVCYNRACVNPAHLAVRTARENTLDEDSSAPAKLHSIKTRCPQGHPYDAQNTRIESNGARRCRKCARINLQNYYERKKAQHASQQAQDVRR